MSDIISDVIPSVDASVEPEDVKVNPTELTEDEENTLGEAGKLYDSFGLQFTIRSINHVVNKEKVTFNQLRSCLFDKQYDLIRACLLIAKAGLIGSNCKDAQSIDNLDDKAWDILQAWVENFGYLGSFHILAIRDMEEHGFFVTRRDLTLMQALTKKNQAVELANLHTVQNLHDSLHQVKALQS